MPDDDTIPEAFRQSLQQVGISSLTDDWTDLPPWRRHPHIIASKLFLDRLRELGAVITWPNRAEE